MDYIIGIGEYAIVSGFDDRIVTHALGSCVAVTFYCQTTKVGAMIHIALPKYSGNHIDSKPGYYADLGLPMLINQLKLKYNFDFDHAKINVFGGANSKRQVDTFMIGPRNLEEVNRILFEHKLTFDATKTGGYVSRTIELNLSSGIVNIKQQPLII